MPEDRDEGERARTRRTVAGVVLILAGILLLGSMWGWFGLRNWWALFIFIPAVVSFVSAWRSWRAQGSLNREAAGSLTGGLVLSFVALMFLFAWDWGLLWPIIIILIGVGILLGWRKR